MSESSDSESPSKDVLPQACAIPFRFCGGKLEFCLVTSMKGRWIFPKGLVDPGETLEETALKESFEEAGLHGQVVGDPLGTYRDHKWGRDLCVTVLRMAVTQCDKEWLESGMRERRWVSTKEANTMLSRPEMQRFLKLAVKAIESETS